MSIRVGIIMRKEEVTKKICVGCERTAKREIKAKITYPDGIKDIKEDIELLRAHPEVVHTAERLGEITARIKVDESMDIEAAARKCLDVIAGAFFTIF